jgi:hypothetical protein
MVTAGFGAEASSILCTRGRRRIVIELDDGSDANDGPKSTLIGTGAKK